MESVCINDICAPEPETSRWTLTVAYFFGLMAILLAIFSQYFMPIDGWVKLIFVYGIPIMIASLILGGFIWKRAFKNNARALGHGLAWWGVLTALGYFATFIIIAYLASTNPGSLGLLERSNPAAPASPGLAWLMVAASFLVIGPAEEYIFRGFIFGGLLRIFQNRHWLIWAFLTSVLFAFVHIYYLLTFGITSSIFFVNIIAISMALSIAYYVSGGNLFIPALLHGLFDASGFLTIATDSDFGIFLRFAMVAVGLFMAFLLVLRYFVAKEEKTAV